MRAERFLAAVVMGGLLAAAPAVLGEEIRYQGVVRGGLSVTGNTLGLSKALNANAPGTNDSIGTFIAAGTAGQDGTYPVGTTADWNANAADATLVLPAGSVVLYAELLWGGSYQYGLEDVTASLGSSVSLSFGGDAATVAPAGATAVTLDTVSSLGFDVHYYLRSADVTTFVAAHGAGTYRVGGVPATQDDLSNTLNAAGWALAVAYESPTDVVRFVSLRVAGDYVDAEGSVDYDITGFCAPASGTVTATAVAAAVDGDCNRTLDVFRAGPTGDPLTALSGPVNPADNFFASQITDMAGALDTSGSFGTTNHDAASGTNVVGGRQGWDVAAVALGSAHLTNGATTLTLQAASGISGDTYQMALVGVEIQVDAPLFAVAGSSQLAEPSVPVGSSTTLTIDLDNLAGTAAADGLLLTMPLPAGVALLAFDIDGIPGDDGGSPVTGGDLTTGVKIGVVGAGASRVVTMELSPTAVGDYPLQPSWSYQFEQCSGDPPTAFATAGEEVVLSGIVQADAGTQVDAGPPADGGGAGDAEVPEDAGAPADGGGPSDASTPADAGAPQDSGTADAGSADAAAPGSDAGVVPRPDAWHDDGSVVDGGEDAGSSGGCGCREAAGAGRANAALGLALLSLVGLRRRRHRGGPGPSVLGAMDGRSGPTAGPSRASARRRSSPPPRG